MEHKSALLSKNPDWLWLMQQQNQKTQGNRGTAAKPWSQPAQAQFCWSHGRQNASYEAEDLPQHAWHRSIVCQTGMLSPSPPTTLQLWVCVEPAPSPRSTLHRGMLCTDREACHYLKCYLDYGSVSNSYRKGTSGLEEAITITFILGTLQ